MSELDKIHELSAMLRKTVQSISDSKLQTPANVPRVASHTSKNKSLVLNPQSVQQKPHVTTTNSRFYHQAQGSKAMVSNVANARTAPAAGNKTWTSSHVQTAAQTSNVSKNTNKSWVSHAETTSVPHARVSKQGNRSLVCQPPTTSASASAPATPPPVPQARVSKQGNRSLVCQPHTGTSTAPAPAAPSAVSQSSARDTSSVHGAPARIATSFRTKAGNRTFIRSPKSPSSLAVATKQSKAASFRTKAGNKTFIRTPKSPSTLLANAKARAASFRTKAGNKTFIRSPKSPSTLSVNAGARARTLIHSPRTPATLAAAIRKSPHTTISKIAGARADVSTSLGTRPSAIRYSAHMTPKGKFTTAVRRRGSLSLICQPGASSPSNPTAARSGSFSRASRFTLVRKHKNTWFAPEIASALARASFERKQARLNKLGDRRKAIASHLLARAHGLASPAGTTPSRYHRTSRHSLTLSTASPAVAGHYRRGSRGNSISRLPERPPNRQWQQQHPQQHTNRSLATHVRKRSLQLLRAKSMKPSIDKSKKLCVFFTRFGKCNKNDCPYIHDSTKIAVCKRFLRGLCAVSPCPYSHEVTAGKLPVCLFFLRGQCVVDSCPYRHVNVSSVAVICADFLQGYCAKGDDCVDEHMWACPQFFADGLCRLGERCRWPHLSRRTKRTKRKRVDEFKTPSKKTCVESQSGGESTPATPATPAVQIVPRF